MSNYALDAVYGDEVLEEVDNSIVDTTVTDEITRFIENCRNLNTGDGKLLVYRLPHQSLKNKTPHSQIKKFY